jgi:hypothetical protein
MGRRQAGAHRCARRITNVALVVVTICAGIGVATGTGTAAPSAAVDARRLVHFELAADAGIVLRDGSFVSDDPNEVADLNRVLGPARIEAVTPLVDPSVPDSAVTAALDDYFTVEVDAGVAPAAVVAALQALPVVTDAYVQPAPAPPPATPDFTPLQTYLRPAPEGVDRAYARRTLGGTGSRVRVVDIEYSWNQQHEDLRDARAALVPNGTPYDPFGDQNHGTAVAGELVAADNGFGVTGVVSDTSLLLVNADNLERGYDLTGALALAASVTRPGDVILIEQQTTGPNGEFVPVEWVPDVYASIRALTSVGRHVVEAAGNGAQNLDDRSQFGWRFPDGKPDSGAIIAGAGENCAAPHRARVSFSTYGRRVNLQGPGDCVVTTGYGGLYSAGDITTSYTAGFSGTSSASPVVAAAVASVSSAFLAKTRRPIPPKVLRDVLAFTGTPQDTRADRGHIGPLPNLARALRILGLGPPPWRR